MYSGKFALQNQFGKLYLDIYLDIHKIIYVLCACEIYMKFI